VSVDPGIVDRFAVARMVRPRREELESVRSSLERSGHLRRHSDGVMGANLDDLVVELDLAAAVEDHVDLLRFVVAMAQRRAPASPQAKQRKSRLLRIQRFASHARLPAVAEPVGHGRILDVVQVDARVAGRVLV
jgi:hypothetical protein